MHVLSVRCALKDYRGYVFLLCLKLNFLVALVTINHNSQDILSNTPSSFLLDIMRMKIKIECPARMVPCLVLPPFHLLRNHVYQAVLYEPVIPTVIRSTKFGNRQLQEFAGG